MSRVNFPVTPSNRSKTNYELCQKPCRKPIIYLSIQAMTQEKLVKIAREFMIRWFRNTIVLQGLYCWNSYNDKTGYNRSI